MSPSYPPLRTFHTRQRRLSPARAEVFEALKVQFALEVEGPPLDLGTVFWQGAPVVLEIGVGGGEALIELAGVRREECIIGVEPHTPGLANVLDAVVRDGLTNVRVVHGDALEFIERLAPGSLAGVRIWFPDPWQKHRQRNRRIVRPDVVSRLVDLLSIGGTLHIATDVADYARLAEQVCSAEPRLEGGIVQRPGWRPETRFEHRGRAAGRQSTDLIWRRV